jgi:signal transduction histidine kinase
MKWTHRTWIELIAIIAMAAMVFILGILQYQWTGQISGTEQQRLRVSLNNGVRDFRQEFSFDFERLCESFSVAPEASLAVLQDRIIGLHSNWIQTSNAPNLLGKLYIAKKEGNGTKTHLDSLDFTSGVKAGEPSARFQQAVWPAELASVEQWIDEQGAQENSISDREAVYYPWTLVDGSPALVRPLFQAASNREETGGAVQAAGFLILQLNGDYLQQQYFPGLVDRHFGNAAQRSFGIEIRSAKAPYQHVYISDHTLPIATTSPEAAAKLFESVSEEARRRGRPALQAINPGSEWQLVVQHPSGSVEVAVAAWRRRNLIISFTLLAVLAVSIALIFSVTRRAERLARLQIDFVSGVSHELCTPLAVITAAAENLADGVAAEPRQIQEYGGLIRDQGRRLERMVDQVLLFAAERSGRTVYEQRPVQVASVVAQSLSSSEPILKDAGFTVEKEINSDLPLVAADPAALSRCIDNLLSNAIKYSAGSRWIAVRAQVTPVNRHDEVQISVQDKGMGIPPADLPHVFEPFYRVQAVREGQMRGVGLGLYLVKRMMEGMGGHVSVLSRPGEGSSFTLHFPLLGQPESSTTVLSTNGQQPSRVA